MSVTIKHLDKKPYAHDTFGVLAGNLPPPPLGTAPPDGERRACARRRTPMPERILCYVEDLRQDNRRHGESAAGAPLALS